MEFDITAKRCYDVYAEWDMTTTARAMWPTLTIGCHPDDDLWRLNHTWPSTLSDKPFSGGDGRPRRSDAESGSRSAGAIEASMQLD